MALPRFHISNPWIRFGLYFGAGLLVLLLLAVLLDQLVMPWYIGLNDSIRVPNVINKSIVEATTTLENRGLLVQISAEYYHKSVPEGKIVSQLPYPNAEVKKGRRIYLVVSKGKETLVMPRLTRTSVREARINLMRIGMELDNVEYAHDDSIPSNFIISQSIPPDSRITNGQKVNVVVSLGPEAKMIAVPNLFGKPREQAEQLIMAAGLVVGYVKDDNSGTFIPNTVTSQMPPAGDSVTVGSTVTITVSK